MRYKWTMKDGTKIFIDEMQDSHLLNSLRLSAERQEEISENVSAAYSMSCGLSGEMALDQIDRDIRMLEDMDIAISKTVSVLREEVRKRNLQELPLRRKRLPLSG